ncbi:MULTISPECIES: ribosomal protein S18-alanine N-acetyltransferase [unclassified Afipia]|uniref:ribosomal protein S18-alanine N-acetyltransferase n=1 Tax=unclassified Afipia TaxID=2642050 RepID=UPI000467610A|nr:MULTISPECIES: ribosomal protein S18-alanine N-acetyltransferase [unclassified Afipia]MAH70535.1 ribosomal-protein-alanine N-acetyltransferase [Afipia sp.]OUX60352.1 MAG: ribosomal-protein-alanine N-acetyltransferase [Afipia sp. TMED4]HAP11240.1 ribosomal-protein-alanine N-acetyltransferase [Afipia sp.]HCX19380.1 ribosomal-protein-alanine N-acetyltransferase [Afipia sp.]
MPRVPAFLSRLFPKLFGRADATVEPANLRDAPRLSQLHRASFHRGWGTDEFEQILIERNALAHRLRLGGSTIGFIVSRTAADEAEILSVAVAQKHRGRGFSRDLLRTHLGHLAGHGLKTVFLEVEENNRPARALYERAGFRVVGRRERYYKDASGEQLNAVVMQRDLS